MTATSTPVDSSAIPPNQRRRARHDHHDHDDDVRHGCDQHPGHKAGGRSRHRPRPGPRDPAAETGLVDPAATGTAGADTAEDGGRAHRLVWLDPREGALHPRNIRDDLSGLADSIATQGVLEALTVIPHAAADGTPGHQIVAGTAGLPPAISAAASLPSSGRRRNCRSRHDARPLRNQAFP